MKISSKALRLYAVTDRSWLKENQTLTDSVEKAILGGVTIVQLREKNTDFEEQLSLAQEPVSYTHLTLPTTSRV